MLLNLIRKNSICLLPLPFVTQNQNGRACHPRARNKLELHYFFVYIWFLHSRYSCSTLFSSVEHPSHIYLQGEYMVPTQIIIGQLHWLDKEVLAKFDFFSFLLRWIYTKLPNYMNIFNCSQISTTLKIKMNKSFYKRNICMYPFNKTLPHKVHSSFYNWWKI